MIKDVPVRCEPQGKSIHGLLTNPGFLAHSLEARARLGMRGALYQILG